MRVCDFACGGKFFVAASFLAITKKSSDDQFSLAPGGAEVDGVL